MLSFAVALVSSGCLSGSLGYTPPPRATPPPPRTLTLGKALDAVWKDIVPALGSRFFVINNLDRASGLINVSYSGDPETYIDCGQIDSWVENARGKRTYNFPAASSRVYELKGPYGLYLAERKMNLEGRINLIMESLSPEKTQVTVNTRYVVTRQTRSHRVDLPSPNATTDTIGFNAGQRAEFPKRGPTEPVACQATGKLETDVLDLFRTR
jgi:hypothetical protein